LFRTMYKNNIAAPYHPGLTPSMDMLLKYHVGSAKDEIMQAIGALPQSVVEQTHQVKAQLQGMFTEMGTMLNGNLDAAGHATVTRALDMFAARFSKSHPSTSAANHKKMVHELVSRATMLLSTVKVASSRQLSARAEASLRTTSAVRSFNLALNERNFMLGVYRSSAQAQKEVQRNMSLIVNPITALRDDIQKAAATAVLLDLDKSWWTIRDKLDAYLDAADSQTTAFTEAVAVLDGYSSKCTADFTELKHAHVQAKRVDKLARTQLQETWHSVEHELGLLVAKMVDSNGFVQLVRLDAASADFKTNWTTICSRGNAAKEAVLLAIDQSLSQGFAKQTWTQLTEVFDEMDMLRSRFLASGMKTPSNQTVTQALERAARAYIDAEDRRSDIALEAAHQACNQESSLVQMPAVDAQLQVKAVIKAMTEQLDLKDDSKKIEAALKTVHDMEVEKDRTVEKMHDLEHEQERVVQKEKERVVEKMHVEKVHDLVEKERIVEKMHDLEMKDMENQMNKKVSDLEEKVRNLEGQK